MKISISGVLTILLSLATMVVKADDKVPCGLKGSVDERISDCSRLPQQTWGGGDGFVLVTRSFDLKEVHKEISTDLLWSDTLPLEMTHYDALDACNSDLEEVGGISGVNWRLPTIHEYKKAEKNGIRFKLPNTNSWFWSSSVSPLMKNRARLFSKFYGVAYYELHRRDIPFSVRCVAKINN